MKYLMCYESPGPEEASLVGLEHIAKFWVAIMHAGEHKYFLPGKSAREEKSCF